MSNVDMCEHDWPGSGCKECRAEAMARKITAPSGTPEMPVKAYYHEAPNEYGGLNKSVGLEVRKQFSDAPLVLEADALAQIACLEGEIAKRDARIVELEQQVIGMRLDVITQVDAHAVTRAELAAIKAQGVVMPEHETSTPSSKWASAGEPAPHGKTYDCERAELSMGEYTDDELANAVFMHDHRSFDIAATMRGEPGSIVLLTAAKERIRWLSRSLDKAIASLNATPAQQPKCKTCDDNGRIGGPSFYAPDEGGEPCPDCSAPVQQVSVPDGWRLVPVEPTPKMIDATWYHEIDMSCGIESQGARNKRIYEAMLAAAPAAPAADAGHAFYGMDGNHP